MLPARRPSSRRRRPPCASSPSRARRPLRRVSVAASRPRARSISPRRIDAMLPLVAALALACGAPPPTPSGGPDRAREAMVAEQIEQRGVRDARTLAAMRTVPRHLFVPPALQAEAYADHPLPIGH